MALWTLAGISIGWYIAAAAVAVGTSVGTSQSTAHQERKHLKTVEEAQRAQVERAEKKAASAKSLAQQEAQQKLKKQRLAQTQTILTSPLGIQDQATTQATTLGG